MYLEQLGGPAFPLLQERVQVLHAAASIQSPKELARAWWRAGAGVEQRDVQLAPGEGLVQHRQVSDDESEETQARSSLNDGDNPREGRVRADVAQAQGEERRSAHVDVAAESGLAARRGHRRAQSPVDEP